MYDWIVFHCMDVPHFMHLSSWWTFWLFLFFFLAVMNTAALNIGVQILVLTYIFIPSGVHLGVDLPVWIILHVKPLRDYQIVLYGHGTISRPLQQGLRVLILPQPPPASSRTTPLLLAVWPLIPRPLLILPSIWFFVSQQKEGFDDACASNPIRPCASLSSPKWNS